MKQRNYLMLVCQECQNKNMVRSDRAKTLDVENYVCALCGEKKRNSEKFLEALGEIASAIKETHVHGKHRYILVDCTNCDQPYWARFDVWEKGGQKCWPCAHPNQQKHGKTGTELHDRWMGIIRRTVYSNDPTHRRVYQNRGIVMCDEWRKSFDAFEKWSLENGYESHLVLDRIDNYKGYQPDNCRWVTPEKNNGNKRKAIYI